MNRAQFVQAIAGCETSWRLDGYQIRTRNSGRCLIEELARRRFGRSHGYDVDGEALGMNKRLVQVVAITADNVSQAAILGDHFDPKLREQLLVATGLKKPVTKIVEVPQGVPENITDETELVSDLDLELVSVA